MTERDERDELLEAAARVLSHYTNRPHCGHDFTCVCKDADINALRATVVRIEEGRRPIFADARSSR